MYSVALILVSGWMDGWMESNQKHVQYFLCHYLYKLHTQSNTIHIFSILVPFLPVLTPTALTTLAC